MATIEIDTVCHDGETPEQTIAFLASEYPGVAGRVVNPHGPGGGCPIVEWSGDTDSLSALLRGAYEFDDDEVSDWLISPKGL